MGMLIPLHLGLANATTLFALALSIWGLVRFFQGQGVDGSYLGALVIGEALIVVQVLVGVFMYGGGMPLPRAALHILYALCAVIAFPAFYAYTRGEDSRREMLLWALLAFFVFGLTIRLGIMG